MGETTPFILLMLSTLSIIFWSIFSVWISRNREKIPGRLFEYLFFLFLFLASYFLTWAASGVLEGPQVLSRISLMVVCVISALYTGYFHYIKKIYN